MAQTPDAPDVRPSTPRPSPRSPSRAERAVRSPPSDEARPAEPATTGTVCGVVANSEPKRISWLTPVVDVVSRRGRGRGLPTRSRLPSTTPVARSRHAQAHPGELHRARAEDRPGDEAEQRDSPMSTRSRPPAVATSASECPAKDWPLSTVKTPTTAATTATTVPPSARCARVDSQRTRRANNQCTSPPQGCRAGPTYLGGTRDHQDPTVENVTWTVLWYERAERRRRGPPRPPSRWRTAAGQLDDAVHHRQKWVHLVGREQYHDLLLHGDAVQGARRPPARCAGRGSRAARPRATDGVGRSVRGRSGPAAAPAQERPDPGVGERGGVDRRQHRVDGLVAVGRRQCEPEAVSVEPEATRSRARNGRSGSSRTFWGT